MRKQIATGALLAGLGLAVTFGCTAQADSATQAPESTAPGCASSGAAASAQPGTELTGAAQPGAVAPGQAHIADMTGQLENAFAKQFEQNAIDQAALTRLISDVVQAFPEAAQARVKIHIDEVFETGKKVASQMPSDQRTKAVTPPPKEQLGRTQQGQLAGWGWGSPYGFGGLGAFGFPSMYNYWGTYPSLGYGYGTGYYGTGLGLGGWYW